MAKTLLRIYQLSDGYAYNSDSLLLVDFAGAFIKRGANVLDVGSGSGIMGLLCARHFGAHITLLDINPYCAMMSYINARTNNINASIIHSDFLDDFISKLRTNGYDKTKNEQINYSLLNAFDCLILNPPFYREGAITSNNPMLSQAKSSTYLPLKEWIKKAKSLIKPHGGIIFCYRPSSLGDIFSTLMDNGFNMERMRLVYPLLEKNASLSLIYARLNSKTPLEIAPPLIMHNSPKQTDFSKEVSNIYLRLKTHSIKVRSSDIVANPLSYKSDELLNLSHQ